MTRKRSFADLIKNTTELPNKFSRQNEIKRKNENKFLHSYLRNTRKQKIGIEDFTKHKTLKKKKSYKKVLMKHGDALVRFNKHKSDLSPISETKSPSSSPLSESTRRKRIKVSESRLLDQEYHGQHIKPSEITDLGRRLYPPTRKQKSPPIIVHDDQDDVVYLGEGRRASPSSSSSSSSASSPSSSILLPLQLLLLCDKKS